MPFHPIPGSTFTFYLPGLEDQANAGLWKSSPTIAAGDFTISVNGGAFEALDNTPTVKPTGGTQIEFVLSAAETTAAGEGGSITVNCVDAAGAEWCSVGITLRVGAPAVNVTKVKDASLTETGAGYLAAALSKLLDVAVPVLTAASVNQTGDNYARLGAPTGASVSADVAAVKAQTAAIEADTQDLQTQVGTGGVGLTAIGDARLANLDATVSSRLASGSYTVPLDATATQAAAAAALAAYDPPTLAELTSAVAPLALEATVGALPTAAENADAVLDELLSGHTIPGSTGAGIAAAGAAGDPWITVLPGSYNSGTAGAIIGALAAIDTTAVTITPANNAGHLTVTAARTFEATISGLTIPATWVTALWTLKIDDSRPDTAALVQLRETNPAAVTDGLQRLNGAAPIAPITAASGALTVTQASGQIGIYLTDELTARLSKATGIGWDVKFIDAAGDSSGADGTADVVLTETKATA